MYDTINDEIHKKERYNNNRMNLGTLLVPGVIPEAKCKNYGDFLHCSQSL